MTLSRLLRSHSLFLAVTFLFLLLQASNATVNETVNATVNASVASDKVAAIDAAIEEFLIQREKSWKPSFTSKQTLVQLGAQKPTSELLPGLYFLLIVVFFAFVELSRVYRRNMLGDQLSTIVDFRKDFPFLHSRNMLRSSAVKATRLPEKADPLAADDPVGHLVNASVDRPMDHGAVHPAVREEDIFDFGASRPFEE